MGKAALRRNIRRKLDGGLLRRFIRPAGFRPPLSWVVQHARSEDWETLLDISPGTLRFRRRHARSAVGRWRRRRISLSRPHAVAFTPARAAIVADTGNHRLVILEKVDRGSVRFRRSIGGRRLDAPHHVIWNPHDSFLYVVDLRAIYRMETPRSRGQVWAIHPRRLGYARSLAILDGRVHVVASSLGSVLRIDSFSGRKLTVFRSPQKRRDAPAGSWSRVGLVLNHVASLDGWYYGTNYFAPEYARGTDPNRNRLIRWRTWRDFEAGQWQDLSACLPPGLVPYFLTAFEHWLHIAAFCHADHRRDGVFRLQSSDFS